MPLMPAEFASRLLAEAQQTHPWLHHRLFRMIVAGELTREQVRRVVREQGCFFLDTLRHAAWKIISVGGFTPTFEDLERQRALIPLVVEEGGHDTIGGKQTAHVSARMAAAMEKHYGVARAALDFYHEHMEVEEDHSERALTILARIAVTDEEQTRGLLALRRAITARRICADGMYEAFVAR
jgi:pyrroloquinoline quinone (PQQ) biosynthesis protein C